MIKIKYNHTDISSMVRRLKRTSSQTAHEIANELVNKGEKCIDTQT